MLRRLAPLTLLTALLLAACTRGSDATPTPEATPTIEASPTVEVTATAPPSISPTATATATPIPTSTPFPRPEPTEPELRPTLREGIPIDTVGAIAVYVRPVHPKTGFTASGPVRVIAVDLVSGRTLASWDLGGVADRIELLGVHDTHLVVRKSAARSAIDGGIFLYDLAGNELRTVYRDPAGQTLIDALLSPDGSTVTVASRDSACVNVCTVLVDVQTGDELQVIPQTDEALATLGGQFPDPIAWRLDSSGVLVAGQPNGHAFFGWATVFLDGSTVAHDFGENTAVRPGPDARWMLELDQDVTTWTPDNLGCELRGAARIHDLATGTVTSRITRPGFAFTESRWSPDGRELLIGWRPLPPADTSCEGYSQTWAAQPITWLRVDAATGGWAQVPDARAIEQSWHPERRLKITCDAIEVEVGDTFIRGCGNGGSADLRVDVRFAPGNAPAVVVDSTAAGYIVGTVEVTPAQAVTGFLRALQATAEDPLRTLDASNLAAEGLWADLNQRYISAPAIVSLSLLVSGDLASDLPPDTFEVTTTSIDVDTAEVTTRLTYEGDTPTEVEHIFVLTRDHNTWLLDDVR